MVKGFGSSYTIDSNFYPLSAVYNPITYILTIVFTKQVVVNDISKIALYMGATKITFVSGEDTIINSQKSDGRILEIQLHENNYVKLIGFTGDLYLDFEGEALTEEIVIGENITKLFDTFNRLKCFIGDFIYMDGIQHPIFVDILSNDNWVVANVSDSSLMYNPIDELAQSITASQSYKSVSDIIEFKEDTQEIVFNFTDVTFSDFSLGSIYEYGENEFMVAGIELDSGVSLGITKDDFLSSHEDLTESILFRADAIEALSLYRGGVTSVDKINNRFNTFYNSNDGLFASDISVYDDGTMLVAESAFVDPIGRLVRLDTFGNITWNFGAGSFNIIYDCKLINNSNLMLSL